jgi:hypothetical protein
MSDFEEHDYIEDTSDDKLLWKGEGIDSPELDSARKLITTYELKYLRGETTPEFRSNLWMAHTRLELRMLGIEIPELLDSLIIDIPAYKLKDELEGANNNLLAVIPLWNR